MSTFAVTLTILVIIIGIIGTIVPVLPGTIVAGFAVLIFAWVDGFQTFGAGTVSLIVLITLVAGTADFWMPLFGAKVGGASLKTIIYGVIGSTLGFIAGSVIPLVGNLIGGLLGYFLGILYAEYQKYGDWDKAVRVGMSGLLGWLIATAIQLTGAFLILIIFIWQVLL